MQNSNSPFSNTKLSPFITCKDYTVSRETFSLLKDEDLEMLLTSPKPSLEDLPKYYESEDYISHTDSKKTIIDKVYQVAKNYAIKRKVKLVLNLVKTNNLVKNTKSNNNPKLLDIGCGTGDFIVACNNANFNVVGVEPNKNAREITHTKLQKSNAQIFENLTEINIKFDVITMWHVLEHVPNLTEYISQLKKLLQPNGTILIAVPNYKSFDANHYKEFWAAFDVPRHLWHFSQKAIKLLFEKENQKVVKTLPMKLDSFYVSLLSEKYKSEKQNTSGISISNFVKAFFIGLKSNIKAKGSKEYSSLIYIIKNN